MTITYIIIALATLIGIGILFLIVEILRSHRPTDSSGLSINAGDRSIVTVRQIGRTTRVDIRPDVHDHWEGSGAIDIKPVGVELTRQLEPELFAEYMSVETSATRKYEIADYIYSIGLSLPYIRGLNEKWRAEQEALSKDSNPATEHTPIDPKGGTMINGIVIKKLEVDPRLRQEPMTDISDDVPPQDSEQAEGESNLQ